MSWRLAALAPLALAMALLAAADTPSFAEKPAPQSRAEIEAIVRDYLLQHPEVIVEALRKLDEQDRAAEAARVKAVVAAERKALFEDGFSFIAGNPKGDVTIVEFYDYNCAYCRQVSDTVRALLKRDKNLRLVLKEWPIRGADSEAAARVAIAAARQARFLEFHFALMAATEHVDEARALKAAGAAGLDMDKLKRDLKAIDTKAVLAQNQALADKLGIDGTPSFLVSDTLIPGAAPLKEFTKLIADTRKMRAAQSN
jgi:protein-disulfide isomerase